jgi:CheY-like chemotaxis protein
MLGRRGEIPAPSPLRMWTSIPLMLVMEDDDATRSFSSTTSPPTASVSPARAGAGEGLRAIEVPRPSLVVLDLVLEVGSGLDLLDRVRAADGLASLRSAPGSLARRRHRSQQRARLRSRLAPPAA